LKRLLHRTLAGALVTVIAGMSAAPCLAADKALSPSRSSSLAKLSPASLQVLKDSAATASRQAQEPSTPSAPGQFFRSKKGALALALVAGSIGFTVWAAHDSRKDVKSPVR
jgi:hypothetical protein